MQNSSLSSNTLKKTPLHKVHVSLGARMAPFGGYDMPIQYEGILAEHFAARKHAVVFDTCHMGEFQFSGITAASDLENLLTCPVASLKIGQCRYGFICNERGGVIDDQILYRLAETDFFMVVNASTQEFDFEWIMQHTSKSTLGKNLSSITAKIDLQGPQSARIMQKLMQHSIENMQYYWCAHNTYRNKNILISRTGYTGEIGFEIYCEPEDGIAFFNDCLECGAKPAGLGARDTLRLEMGMPLYGHELCDTRNPAQTGFKRAISTEKRFIGSDVVLNPAQCKESLVALVLESRRASRSGDSILSMDNERIGEITSGSYAPSLEKAIALGYVAAQHAQQATQVIIDTGRSRLEATVTSLPFYKHATGRKPISDFL